MQAMITQLKAECSGKQKEIETLKVWILVAFLSNRSKLVDDASTQS